MRQRTADPASWREPRRIGLRCACIGCGAPVPGMRAGRACDACRARFAVHDPDLVVDPWLALQILLVVPLVAGSLMLLMLALAILPHLLMVALDLGPAALLLYFGVFAVGARIGAWLEREGLR